MSLSPEIKDIAEADALILAEGNTEALQRSGARPAGVEEHGTYTRIPQGPGGASRLPQLNRVERR